MNRRRRYLVALTIAALVIVVAAEIGRRYAARFVIARVAAMYGGRVEADGLQLGWHGGTLAGLRLFDADGEHVLVRARQAEADLSAWSVVRGQTMPRRIVLKGPQLTLRFDESGQLLSRVPFTGAAVELPPEIDVQDGSARIEQEGREATEIGGATAKLVRDKAALRMEGSLADASWGTWQFAGNSNLSFQQLALSAGTQDLDVNPQWLRRLPLVPSNIWDEVVATGIFQTQLKIQLTPPERWPSIDADVRSSRTRLTVHGLAVDLNNLTVIASANEQTATLRSFAADVAGGHVSASGDAQLTGGTLQGSIAPELRDIDVAELMTQFALPEQVQGQLNGAARMRMSRTNKGDIAAAGEGRATISGASVAGVPVEPIILELHSPELHRPELTAGGQGASLSGRVVVAGGLRDAPIEPLLQLAAARTNLRLPPIDGQISAALRAEIPLATPADISTWLVNSDLTSSQIDLAGTKLTALRGSLDLSYGVAQVAEFKASIRGDGQNAPGHITVRGRADLTTKTPAGIEVTIENAPLAPLGSLVNLSPLPAGTASAKVEAHVPADYWMRPDTWKATGHLTAGPMHWSGRRIDRITADMRLIDGKLELVNTNAAAGGVVANGQVTMSVEKPFAYTARFEVPATDLEKLAELVIPTERFDIRGRMQASASAKGSLEPLALNAEAQVNVTDARFETINVDRVSFQATADQQTVKITGLGADALGGQLKAEANVSLLQQPAASVEGEFADLHLDRLPADLLPRSIDPTGTVSGRFSLAGSRLSDLQGSLEFHSPEIKLHGVSSRGLEGKAHVERGLVHYELRGEVLDGRVNARGQLQLTDEQPAQPTGDGHVALEHIDVRRAVHALAPDAEMPLDGSADLAFDYVQRSADVYPTGKGSLVVNDLRWERQEITRRLQTDVVIADGQLRLPDISTQYGEGSLRGDVAIPLVSDAKGSFDFSLDRISLPQALAPWPEVAKEVRGSFDARLRGSIGRAIVGGGSIGASRLRVAGIDASNVRLPVNFVYAFSTGRGELHVQESTTTVGQGRIVSNATATWHRGLSIVGKAQVTGLGLQSLSPAAGSFGVAGGHISGTANFSATDLRSINDLTASYDFKLLQPRPSELPVLGALSRYVLPVGASSAAFSEGEVRGRLAGGIAYIQRFTLTGSQARVMVDGTVSLAGRLKLNVVAQTGGSAVGPLLARRILLPLVAAESLPVALLVRANTLLAEQVVYLRVGGTIHSPTVQVEAAPQLGYEALRFFALGQTGLVP